MTIDPNDIITGLTLVGGAVLCLSVGFMVKSQSRMLEIQSRLLMAQTELAEWMAPRSPALTEIRSSWRDMPEEGRAMLRKSLREVLTDMDREMN